jgi:hypothetical protein
VTTSPEAKLTDDLDPDQPQREPLRYRGRRLDGPGREFHAAVDALQADTVPYTYYLKVLAGRDQRTAAER